LRADPVPHFLTQRLQRLDRADHHLEFDHFAGVVEFDEIDALELPFADIGGKFQRGIVSAGDKRAVIAENSRKSAPPSSVPAKSLCVRESAIARMASETQYVRTVAGPAGRDRLTRQSDASRPGFVATERRQCMDFAHQPILPVILFEQRRIRTGPR
jgi:hypothetical protein